MPNISKIKLNNIVYDLKDNNASDSVKSTTVTEIMTLTESQYEAILSPLDTTLYIIKES